MSVAPALQAAAVALLFVPHGFLTRINGVAAAAIQYQRQAMMEQRMDMMQAMMEMMGDRLPHSPAGPSTRSRRQQGD